MTGTISTVGGAEAGRRMVVRELHKDSVLPVVGLTGGIASGKSAVARIMGELRVPVLDADRLAREVVRPGSPGLAAVTERFGQGVLGEGGALDRDALARVVFRDAAARRRLEAIVHPAVAAAARERAARYVAAGAPWVLYDAALLVETGAYRELSALILVAAPLELQIARLMERDGLARGAALRRIEAQLPLEEKRRVADFVIENTGGIGELRSAVTALKQRIDTLFGVKG